MSNESKKIEYIKIHTEKAFEHLQLLKNSARWKFGNAVINFIDKVMFRKKTKLSIEKLEEHLNTITKITETKTKNAQNLKFLDFKNAQKITFLVSETNIKNSIFGDTFVAHHFKENLELNTKIKCELTNHLQHKNLNSNVIIALLWDTKIEKFANENTLKIAWIRNHTERWLQNTSFSFYDIILCSSQKILDHIINFTNKPCYLFPIAANTIFFNSDEKIEKENKAVLVANKFNNERNIDDILKTKNNNIEIFGTGWDENIYNNVNGKINHFDLPKLYQKSKFVIDSANQTTKNWASLNSRIFNAIACKSLIFTDAEEAANLFLTKIPVYKNEKELANLIEKFSDKKTYTTKVNQLYNELISKHNFKLRSNQFKLIASKKLKIDIKIAPTENKKNIYGDYYFAQDLKTEFEKFNHIVNIDCIENWYKPNAYEADLVIALQGLQKYKAAKNQTTFLWLISHPNEVKINELKSYNFVFCASSFFTQKLKQQGIANCETLIQCTNNKKFKHLKNTEQNNKLLFVGNSRNVFRKSVKYAIENNFEIDIYGNNWDQFVDKKYIKSSFVKNEELYKLYNSYNIVLNDHWQDMIENGFLSNRIFDALACNANVLTDLPKNCEEIFDDLSVFENSEDFKNKVLAIKNTLNKSLNNLKVNNLHTFKNRTEAILNKFYELTND